MSASITSGQRKQIERMCQDAGGAAIEAIGLGFDGAQRVIGRGDELRSTIIDRIRELSGSRFADEERKSNYGYPKGYSVKDIVAQTNRLRELFPGVGYADEKVTALPLPGFADKKGWFAIPRWEAFAPSYGKAFEKVLAAIARTRRFYNWREGQLGPDYLRQSELSLRMFQILAEQQKGYDILVVPAQFGLRHRGKSVRRSREVFAANEFGLGAFACGIMLLTHPERFSTGDELWIDCAGDEFSDEADGRFESAPCFNFYDDKVRFDTHWVSSTYERYGSASGFLPQ